MLNNQNTPLQTQDVYKKDIYHIAARANLLTSSSVLATES